MIQPILCPCDSRKPYIECCEKHLSGKFSADTALSLMRSRYCAYSLADVSYLLRTWLPATRPSKLKLVQEQRWLGLKIKALKAGEPSDDEGFVEFVARYKVAGKGYRLHENSRFLKLDGDWYYADGIVR